MALLLSSAVKRTRIANTNRLIFKADARARLPPRGGLPPKGDKNRLTSCIRHTIISISFVFSEH
jgi:hypothetical protein